MSSHSMSSRAGHPSRPSAKVLPFPTPAQRRGASSESKPAAPSKAVTQHHEALHQLRQTYLERHTFF
ncbi:MAG TPA: hypothetical protein V6D06_21025 [Trichocoleus sp.]